MPLSRKSKAGIIFPRFLSKRLLCVKKGRSTFEGRADGIIVGGDFPIIDEIKSTVMGLEDFYQQQQAWHLGQASCYALMYLHANHLEKCGIRLTYISQIDNSQKVVEDVYSLTSWRRTSAR
jgi:hypothetical protein